MTAIYDEFMRQYRMTGREKADGYSRSAFVGLNEQEKEEIFDLLIQELPFSVEWLFFLNPQKAFEVTKSEEAKSRRDGYFPAYILQAALMKFSGDLSYQNHMIADYPTYISRLKPQVVDAVANTPVNEASLNFFKQVILTESNHSAVASAAFALLNAFSVPCASQKEIIGYTQLNDDLCNDNVEIKLNAITRLTRYERGFTKE